MCWARVSDALIRYYFDSGLGIDVQGIPVYQRLSCGLHETFGDDVRKSRTNPQKLDRTTILQTFLTSLHTLQIFDGTRDV